MATQGLVRRIATPGDGRGAEVYITDEGRERALALKAVWKRLERETLDGLDKKSRKRLVRLLAEVEAALDGASAGPADGADREPASARVHAAP